MMGGSILSVRFLNLDWYPAEDWAGKRPTPTRQVKAHSCLRDRGRSLVSAISILPVTLNEGSRPPVCVDLGEATAAAGLSVWAVIVNNALRVAVESTALMGLGLR